MSVELITNDNVIKAQQGDEESLNLILLSYKKFIFMNSRNYFLMGADQDDLMQEGMIGLMKAIKAFKGDKEASFKTFATLCIKRQLITAIKSHNTQKNQALNSVGGNSLDTEDGREIIYEKSVTSSMGHNPEEMVLSREKLDDLNRFSKENFSPIEREVFLLLVKGYSYRDIAEKTEKSLKVIDNTIQRIKRKSQEWYDSY